MIHSQVYMDRQLYTCQMCTVIREQLMLEMYHHFPATLVLELWQ